MRVTVFLVVGLVACVGCGRGTSQHVTSDGVVIVDPDGFRSPYIVAMRDEDYELAETIARKKIDDDQDDYRSWLALTYPLMLTGQFEAAIESCDKAIAIAPNDKTLLYTRGFIAQEQGDACLDDEAYDKADEHFNTAIQYYTKAIDLDSDFPDPHYGLAAAHEGLGNDTLVIQHAKRYLELHPDSPKKNDALDMIRMAKEYIAEADKTEQTDEPEPE